MSRSRNINIPVYNKSFENISKIKYVETKLTNEI